MMKKVYYDLCFRQKSPLRIGNTGNERTDNDLMVDGRGLPFIPGSSIAGVLRSMLSDDAGKRIFGTIDDEQALDSKLLIGDAILSDSAVVLVSKRDGVALDKWGTVNNKFDFEAAETSGEYHSIIEWGGTDTEYIEEIEETIDPLFGSIIKNGVSFGARTTRGYGDMSVSVLRKEFSFPEDIDRWLEFSPYSAGAFTDSQEMEGKGDSINGVVRITAEISIDGNFSVSNPTSAREPVETGASPDKVPLKNMHGNPVISGSAWAGTFRHHIASLCERLGIDEHTADSMFGINNVTNHDYSRSAVSFEETEIIGGKEVVITRNAIDRFTGGAKNTGLFTAEVCYGGQGELRMSYDPERLSSIQKQLLSLTLYDLQLGLVTIGGENGVGRGRARIGRLTVNGTDRTKQIKDICDNADVEAAADLLEVTACQKNG